MFVLQPKPTFKVDVTIPSPTGDGKIEFEFKHKGKEALGEWLKSLTPKEGEDARPDVEVLGEIIEGWAKVDTKYSVEALGQLLDNYPASARAIFDTYIPYVMEGKGREKNSGK